MAKKSTAPFAIPEPLLSIGDKVSVNGFPGAEGYVTGLWPNGIESSETDGYDYHVKFDMGTVPETEASGHEDQGHPQEVDRWSSEIEALD